MEGVRALRSAKQSKLRVEAIFFINPVLVKYLRYNFFYHDFHLPKVFCFSNNTTFGVFFVITDEIFEKALPEKSINIINFSK